MFIRCSAKHISKPKCAKRTSFGALLEVEMFKKCRPLRREAHFEVKMLKPTLVQTMKRRFVWQAQGILHPAKSEQKVR